MENIDEKLNDDVQSSLENSSLKELVFEQIKASNRLYKIITFLSVGLVLVSVLAGIGFFRRPKVLVAVQTPDGQRITQMDDVNFGATEQIQMGEDNLNDRDKKELVENFLQTYYGVDLASRSKDVPKALSMLVPDSARQVYKILNEQGLLQRERDESWSGSWKTESFEVDRKDKNMVLVIGTQNLRRLIGGKAKTERIQYKIPFILHTEGKRDSSPLRTGYWILNFKSEEISRNEIEGN